MNIVQAVRAYRNSKASLYAIVGLLISGVIHITPFYIAYLYIFDRGELILGILFPLLFWITVALAYAALPIIWIVGIFTTGFLDSTLGCLLFLLIFSLPDLCFWLAERQATKAQLLRDCTPSYQQPP